MFFRGQKSPYENLKAEWLWEFNGVDQTLWKPLVLERDNHYVWNRENNLGKIQVLFEPHYKQAW